MTEDPISQMEAAINNEDVITAVLYDAIDMAKELIVDLGRDIKARGGGKGSRPEGR